MVVIATIIIWTRSLKTCQSPKAQQLTQIINQDIKDNSLYMCVHSDSASTEDATQDTVVTVDIRSLLTFDHCMWILAGHCSRCQHRRTAVAVETERYYTWTLMAPRTIMSLCTPSAQLLYHVDTATLKTHTAWSHCMWAVQ